MQHLVLRFWRLQIAAELSSLRAQFAAKPAAGLALFGAAIGVVWALRAQSRKKNQKMGPRGLSAPGIQKVQNRVKNESK